MIQIIKDQIRNLSNFDKQENIDTIYTELSTIYDIKGLNEQIIEDQTLDNLTMFNAIIQHIARDFNIKSNYPIVKFVKKVINDSNLINKGKQNLLSLYYSGYNFPYAILSRYSKFKKDILEILMKNEGQNITTEFTGNKYIEQGKFIDKITFLEQFNKGDFFTAQYYFNLESSEVKVNESIYLTRNTTLLHLLYDNFVKQIRLMIKLSGDNIKNKKYLPKGDFEITKFVGTLGDDGEEKMKKYFERNELDLYTYFFQSL